MRVFGFDEAIADMEKILQGAEGAEKVLDEYGDKMKERAIQKADSQLSRRTGKGAGGIVSEKSAGKVEIGWSAPFYYFFHEVGYHALDNRKRKAKVYRKGKSRTRDYKRTKATWVPPSPHMRPAFDELQGEFVTKIQQKVQGD